MKRLWKIALVAVFALVLAIPMALTGCGSEKFTVKFDVLSVRMQGNEETVVTNEHYGSVDLTKVTDVKQDSKFKIQGNKITIGGKTVTATGRENSMAEDAYEFKFKEWRVATVGSTPDVDIETKKVTSNLTVLAVFERVAAVYTVSFDANYDGFEGELPTIQVTYGTAIDWNALPAAIKNIKRPGYTLKTTLSKGNLAQTGWSIDKNAVDPGDELGASTNLKPSELNSNYRDAMKYTKKTGLTEDEFYNSGNSYYTKDNKGKYNLEDVFEEGVTYYLGEPSHPNVQTNINYVNKTITLYATWLKNYANVNFYKDWDGTIATSGNNKGAPANGSGTESTAKVQLRVNGELKYAYDRAENVVESRRVIFNEIELVDEQGQQITYEVWIERNGVYVNSGFSWSPYYNNGSITGAGKGYVNVGWSVNATAIEGMEDNVTITGAGVVEPGASATLTATAAEGYHFVGWYDNAACTGDAVSTNATYTIENVTTTKNLYAKVVAD